MHPWLRTLAPRFFPQTRTRPNRRSLAPPCDLRVELLEDRSLPSTTLMLSLTAPATIAPGGAIDDVLTLSNTGSADAVNVKAGDPTTLGTTYVTQSQTAGPAFTLSESGGSVLDTISTLPAGSTASFSLVVLVSSSTSNGTWLSDSASVQTDTTLTGSSVTSALGSTTVYDFGTVSVTNPGPQSSTEGSSVSLTISASDSSSGTLTYAASNLPPGLAINPSTGAIAGTVALGAAADSPYTTTVTAGDGTFSARADVHLGRQQSGVADQPRHADQRRAADGVADAQSPATAAAAPCPTRPSACLPA